ncbi:MAG TPA: ParB/RepB/Spo0J family partition protein, partial [Phycisphaerae bacterium]|nr:ParB/RepB/Spo0J family partition protein [Phycisphaerae bacterium]
MTRKDDTTPAPSNPKSAISNQQSAITVHQLPPSAIAPTPDNPRTINEKSPEFLELVASVKAVGVNVPVACRPDGDGHILIYGERRLRAARLAGRETIPALVYDGLTPAQAFELTFAENYQREDLTPMEECKAVQLLSAKYGGDTRAVAAKLGRSERWVQQRARLDNLSPRWRKKLTEDGVSAEFFTAGHLAAVARLDRKVQDEFTNDFF